MAYVLGETIYECELNDLPKNCYYLDTIDNVLVGKFDQIKVFMCMEIIYCPQFNIKISNNNSPELDNLKFGLLLCDTVFSYEAILKKNSSDIEVLKGKILDFYIEHKPIFTKSAKLN